VAAHRFLGDLPQAAPSMVVAVPVKYLSTNAEDRPTASKICAPQ
jgi:hypothetical protein